MVQSFQPRVNQISMFYIVIKVSMLYGYTWSSCSSRMSYCSCMTAHWAAPRASEEIYMGCTTNGTPERGQGVQLEYTFFLPGVPPGVHRYHTLASGVLQFCTGAYGCITGVVHLHQVVHRARSGCMYCSGMLCFFFHLKLKFKMF